MSTTDWRGVSFIARSFQLESTVANSSYLFVSPFPSQTLLKPSIHYRATVIKIIGKPIYDGIATAVDMNRLVDPSYESPGIVYKKVFDDVQFLAVRGTSQLGIRQFGPVPIGAWNPVNDQEISLISTASGLALSEKCNAAQPKTRHDEKEDIIVLDEDPLATNPVLDLIGKPILIWSNDINASASVNDKEIITLNGNDNYGKVKTNDTEYSEFLAIVFEPPFAVRMAMVAASSNDESSLKYFGPSWTAQRESCIQRLYIDRYDTSTKDEIRPEIDLTHVLEEAKKFIREEGSMVVSPVRIGSTQEMIMNFSYPELPEQWGFSLWGIVPELTMNTAKGGIMLDSTPLSIVAPATLEIHGIEPVDEYQSFITLGPSGASDFRLKFRSISVNDQFAYTNWQKWQTNIEYMVIISAILGLAIGIIAYFKK